MYLLKYDKNGSLVTKSVGTIHDF